jgi:hypothetical protein
MSGYGTPKITSDWFPADTSQNHLEFAKTERTATDGVLAMRPSVNRDKVTTVTIGQLRNLRQAIEPGGPLAHLIEF